MQLLLEPGKAHGQEPLRLVLGEEFMRTRARSLPPGTIDRDFLSGLKYFTAQYSDCTIKPPSRKLLRTLKRGGKLKGQGVYVTSIVTPEEAQRLLPSRQKDECHREMWRLINFRSQTLKNFSQIFVNQCAPAEMRRLLGEMTEYILECFEEAVKGLLSEKLIEVMKNNLEFTFLAEIWLQKHEQGNRVVIDSSTLFMQGRPIIWLNKKNEATLLVLDDSQRKTASS